MLTEAELCNLQQIAHGIAAQFGSNCEVVVHTVAEGSAEHSIYAIENGHVSGRTVGDGPSQIVLEQLTRLGSDPPDHLCYLTKTPNGRILKSSSMYIRDSAGQVAAILSINFDISALSMLQNAVSELISPAPEEREPQPIPLNVNDLLDELISRSEELVGKPAALMNKDDKIRAIQFLNRSGALLVTKSGEKIAKYFGISKYTLYSYLDMKQEETKND